MLKYCCLLILFISCVRTTEHVYPSSAVTNHVSEINERFSWWPSVHNAANLLKYKRQAGQVVQEQPVVNEGGDKAPLSSSIAPSAAEKSENAPINNKPISTSSATTTVPANATTTKAPPAKNATELKANSTVEKPKQLDFSNPGVLKRGFIVFGGFALLAVAYFIFYRTKRKNNDSGNTHSLNEGNQFRYGVLQSEDRRDNLELSRVPLTMESDDDDDEDLEIFDLEQKKKSLSYVNLQTNDEDLVFDSRNNAESDRDNLLLDIEDGTSQTLINWSSSGSKSIL